MDFLSEFSKRVSNVARSVTDKGREGAEANRLSEELRAATAELDRLFAMYGRVCFAGENGDATADLVAQIRAGMARVEALSARREAWQGARKCPSCGAPQARDARFCSGCGKRLSDPPAEPAPEADDARYCPKCGASVAPDERFCPVCGTGLEGGADEPAPAFEPDARVLDAIDVEEPVPDDAD